MTPVERYIRDYAASIGLNPDIVMQVVLSEGGQESLTNLTRQSLVGAGTGNQEQSYGPLQLNVRGGLGARALAAGIDPRDPKQAMAAIKFGLDVMKREGLGAWEGWKGGLWAANAGPGTRADVPFPDAVTSAVYNLPRGSIDEAKLDTPSSMQPIGSKLPGSPYDLPQPEAPVVVAADSPSESGGARFGGTGLDEPATVDPLVTKKKKSFEKNPFEKVGAAVAKLGAQPDRSTLGGIQNVPNPPLSMLPAMSSVDPTASNNQRNALVAALMRLNSGQLWPMPGMGGGAGG